MDKDGSLLALDDVGNVKGGIRTPYVDVPAAKFGVPYSGAEPPIKNPHPFIAARGEAAQNQLCGLANYQISMTPEQLKKLYRDKKSYVVKVAQRYDELVKEGWALPAYRSVVLEDAARSSSLALVRCSDGTCWGQTSALNCSRRGACFEPRLRLEYNESWPYDTSQDLQ